MKRLYGAFDLHSSNNYLGISDEKDRKVYKKRLPNMPDVILAELKPYRNDLVGIKDLFDKQPAGDYSPKLRCQTERQEDQGTQGE